MLKPNESRGKLEALREREPATAASPDKILEILAAGAAFDISAIEIPGDNARREEAKIENDIAAWRRAHDIAEKAIPDRQRAVEIAERKIEIAARMVISSSFDIGQLISDAEEAAAAIVDRRTKLMHIRTFLEDGESRKAIDAFLGRPWLIHELNGAWQNHPAIARYRDAHAALTRDAAAPLPA
jgi:hypothetical protein